MTTVGRSRRLSGSATLGIATVVLIAILVPVLAAGAAPAARVGPAAMPAAGSPYRWAFGGSLASSYSCTTTHCPGGTSSPNRTLSLTWDIALNWVAIYTQTNISGTQTEFQVQTAEGISLAYGFSACLDYPTCETESASVSVHGVTLANGSTNVTAGVTTLTAGGTPGTVPALAVTNATSRDAFNFSGNVAVTIPGGSGVSLSASFDVGGSESSTIDLAAPLGLVPVSVTPGDAWTSSEPYTAGGSYVGGFSASATVNGTTEPTSSWVPGTVATSGTLNLTGNDTGSTKLYDNTTQPPTTLTAQDIDLTFTSGNFSASDGWLFASTAVDDSILNAFGGSVGSGSSALSVGLPSSESTYYTTTLGFVGENLTGNASGLFPGEPGGPTIALHVGPEPVSAAEGQYASILSGPSGGGGFPLTLVVVWAVVVAAAAIVATVLVTRRR